MISIRKAAPSAAFTALILAAGLAAGLAAAPAPAPTPRASRAPQQAPSAAAAQQQADAMAGPADPAPLYVATFIDLMPPNIVTGTAAIKRYVLDTRKDAGNKSTEAIAQVSGRANHLIVLEVWQNHAAYEKHESSPHTKDFKTRLIPLIGAPLDEREHFLLQ